MSTNQRARPSQAVKVVTGLLVLLALGAHPAVCQTTKEIATNQQRGVNLSLYFRCYQESDADFSHGGLLERPILTAGDPQHVTKPGAVLIYAQKFHHAFLEAHTRTQPAKHSEQEILFIVKGAGVVTGSDRKATVENGTAVLLPPNMEHTISNESSEPMEILIVTEAPLPSFKPRSEMLVRYLRELPVTHIAHWSYAVQWLFKEEDGLAKLSNLLVVTQDAMTIGSPHAHIPGWEEVWYKMGGKGIAFVGSQILPMPDGCGYISPPDGVTPHSSINVTNEPQKYFYFAYYLLKK